MTADALLIQVGEHAAKIGSLEERFTRLGSQITEMATRLSAISGTQQDQGELLRQLDGAADSLTDLMNRFDALFPPDAPGAAVSPGPTIRWAELDAAGRQRAVADLTAWVNGTYRPQYERLAAKLPACFAEHPYCLRVLDEIRQTYRVCFEPTARTQRQLQQQLEFDSRVLPALAELMAEATGNCIHQQDGDVTAWAEQIYRPSFGYLSAGLPACFAEHPFAVEILAIAMRLWRACFLPSATRDSAQQAASQAEFVTRILPVISTLIGNATGNGKCEHQASAGQW